jgi:hypothetical protein
VKPPRHNCRSKKAAAVLSFFYGPLSVRAAHGAPAAAAGHAEHGDGASVFELAVEVASFFAATSCFEAPVEAPSAGFFPLSVT